MGSTPTSSTNYLSFKIKNTRHNNWIACKRWISKPQTRMQNPVASTVKRAILIENRNGMEVELLPGGNYTAERDVVLLMPDGLKAGGA